MGARCADQGAEAVFQKRLRQHQHHRGDRGHAGQKQKQLSQDDPALTLALAFQQELHGGPLDPAATPEVDQVNQDRRRKQGQAPEQRGIDEAGHDEEA
jgi:hypothetical protein